MNVCKICKKVPGREQETKYIKPVTFLFFKKVKETLLSPERTYREHYTFKHIPVK